jgi:hypothetical protein
VSVSQGKAKIVDLNVQIVNPNTGAKTVNYGITTPNWYFVYNDNNVNSYIDAGDSILLNQTTNFVAGGFKFSLVRGENTIAGPKELP